jgi:hypothetical protein
MSTAPLSLELEAPIVAYLQKARSELPRLTGEKHVIIGLSLDGHTGAPLWTTYTDNTCYLYTKTLRNGLLAQIEEKQKHPRKFV